MPDNRTLLSGARPCLWLPGYQTPDHIVCLFLYRHRQAVGLVQYYFIIAGVQEILNVNTHPRIYALIIIPSVVYALGVGLHDLMYHAPLQRNQILRFIHNQDIEQRTVTLFDKVLDHIYKVYLACFFFVVTKHLIHQFELLVVQPAISYIVKLLLDTHTSNSCHLNDGQVRITALAGSEQNTFSHSCR